MLDLLLVISCSVQWVKEQYSELSYILWSCATSDSQTSAVNGKYDWIPALAFPVHRSIVSCLSLQESLGLVTVCHVVSCDHQRRKNLLALASIAISHPVLPSAVGHWNRRSSFRQRFPSRLEVPPPYIPLDSNRQQYTTCRARRLHGRREPAPYADKNLKR